jgi:RecA-family ATPase
MKLIRVADVQPERVSWLWPGYIPLGKITLLDGDPGLGKSNITLDLAARVTRGMVMPDGSQGDVIGPADVIVLSAEDGIADTIRPRLEAAGADLARVFVLESFEDTDGLARLPEIPTDLDLIEEIVAARQAALLIVDPLMAFLAAATNSFRDQDVRRALAPVKLLSERTGAGVLVVRHLNKSTGGSAIYRGGGSIGIIGAARAGLLVGTDPDDESGARRVLATTKHNLGREVPSLAFHIEQAGDACRVSWDGTSEHSAGAILSAAEHGVEERDAISEAATFLEEMLADGEVEATKITAEARKLGIAEKTLRRAKSKIGVRAVRHGFGSNGVWYWSPAPIGGQETPIDPIDGYPNRMANNGDDGHVWTGAAGPHTPAKTTADPGEYCRRGTGCQQIVRADRPCPVHGEAVPA